MSPIRDAHNNTTDQELAACRLWEARLERELADIRDIISGLERDAKERDGD